MNRTLYETYMNAYDHISRLQWRVFGQNRRKICNDYGAMADCQFDDLEVVTAEVKETRNGNRYVRVVVKA